METEKEKTVWLKGCTVFSVYKKLPRKMCNNRKVSYDFVQTVKRLDTIPPEKRRASRHMPAGKKYEKKKREKSVLLFTDLSYTINMTKD